MSSNSHREQFGTESFEPTGEWMKEREGKIYYYHENMGVISDDGSLMFDHSAQIGDTLHNVIEQWRMRSDSRSYSPPAVLTSIDTMYLNNGEPRRRWIFHCANGRHLGPTNEYDGAAISWVEGMGEQRGWDWMKSFHCEQPEWDAELALMACYSLFGQTLYQSPFEDECFVISVSNDEPGGAGNLPLTVYPNPAGREINLRNVNVAEAALIDTRGQIIRRWQQLSTLDIGGIPSGFYLLRVEDGRGLTGTVKVIIQQ